MSTQVVTRRLTQGDLAKLYAGGEKVVMFTAYDASFARLLDAAGVECLLIGDSLGNVIQGHDTTLPVTVADIAYHKPTDNTVACEFARAAFDRGEYATNDTERASLAVQGIAACREVLKRDAKCVPAHFYLGLNLGQLARTKMLGALPLVDEMEGSFKTARQLDESFAFAGSDRFLGQLYLQAPGWPTSVGSKSKARSHLQRAVIEIFGFGIAEEHALTWRSATPIRAWPRGRSDSGVE